MKLLKRWNDLPRHSAMENKEETLNRIIVRKKKSDLSFNLSVMFSVIAIFWLFYMR